MRKSPRVGYLLFEFATEFTYLRFMCACLSYGFRLPVWGLWTSPDLQVSGF